MSNKYKSAFLIGDPNYYKKFGFKLSSLYGINHESMPVEYVMVKEFVDGTLDDVNGLVSM